MILTVTIPDQLVSDLAVFQGVESLSESDVAALVYQTVVEKASHFVNLRADEQRAAASAQIQAASDARKAEIASAISVEPVV
jgi:hypothetical protein